MRTTRFDPLRIVFGSGTTAPAVSLAYFAAFHAAKGVIAFSRGRDPRTRKGVLIRFRELAVQESDFPQQTANLISQLVEERSKTDYDFMYRDKWKAENTSAVVRKSETFIGEVHSWVHRHVESADPQ